MYKLKQIPEDFIVEEIPLRKPDEGQYVIVELKKTNYNTEDAVQTTAKALHVNRKQISYAGNKDKHAVTTQYITIYKVREERINNLELKDIKLRVIGRTSSPISLGDLKGNKFTITIRNLDESEKVEKKTRIPNYYDSQRFSTHNGEIGKYIVKKQFKEACKLITKIDNKHGPKITEWLHKNNNDYVNALKQLPVKVLQIYAHSYQSLLWNKTVEKYLEKEREQTKIPIIGFGTETEGEIESIISEIMEKENVKERDFIIREFPKLSLEGSHRNLYANIENLKISNKETDELNPNKYKVTVQFELGKGSYATMVVKYLVKN